MNIHMLYLDRRTGKMFHKILERTLKVSIENQVKSRRSIRLQLSYVTVCLHRRRPLSLVG